MFSSKNGLFFQKVDTLRISKMVYFFIFGQKMCKKLLKIDKSDFLKKRDFVKKNC